MLPSECPDVQNLNSHCLQFSQQFCVTTNSASHQLPAIRAVCETKKSIPTTNPQCSPRTSSPGKSTKSPWLSLSRVTSHIHKPAPLLPVLSSRGHHSHLQYHGLSHHLPHFTPWKSVISSSTVWTPPLSLPQQILCSSWMELWPKSASFQVSLSFPAPLLPHGFPPDCSLISDHSTTPSTF